MFDTKTLDKEVEQVRLTWSRYRGGHGTCVSVTGRTCAGDSRDSVIVTVYLLQLYQNRSRLLGYVNCSSPLRHLLGHLLKHFLRRPLGHSLGRSLRHLLRHPIQAQNCHLYSRA